jgi:hypothetical protein
MAFLMVALLGVASARAQEAATEDEAAETQAPRRTIRVLDNPYDIASFYRSSSSGPYFHAPVDFYHLRPSPYGPPTSYRGQYPIASYYRSQQGNYFGLQTPVAQNPYAIASYYRSSASNDVRFWYGGYGPRGGERREYGRYWNSIGENGDLFLMVPTVLAPVGALSAIYYSGR